MFVCVFCACSVERDSIKSLTPCVVAEDVAFIKASNARDVVALFDLGKDLKDLPKMIVDELV